MVRRIGVLFFFAVFVLTVSAEREFQISPQWKGKRYESVVVVDGVLMRGLGSRELKLDRETLAHVLGCTDFWVSGSDFSCLYDGGICVWFGGDLTDVEFSPPEGRKVVFVLPGRVPLVFLDDGSVGTVEKGSFHEKWAPGEGVVRWALNRNGELWAILKTEEGVEVDKFVGGKRRKVRTYPAYGDAIYGFLWRGEVYFLTVSPLALVKVGGYEKVLGSFEPKGVAFAGGWLVVLEKSERALVCGIGEEEVSCRFEKVSGKLVGGVESGVLCEEGGSLWLINEKVKKVLTLGDCKFLHGDLGVWGDITVKRFLSSTSDKGSFVSSVLPLSCPTEVGTVLWSGDGDYELYWRAGFSPSPGEGWSRWRRLNSSEDIKKEWHGEQFLQFKVELGEKGVLRSLKGFYRSFNSPPVIEYFEFVVPKRPGSSPSSGANPVVLPGRSSLGSLRWKVSEPDGDIVNVEVFLSRDGSQWEKVGVSSRTSGNLPFRREWGEGVFYAKLVVDDAPSNFVDVETREKIAGPFVVDASPPTVRVEEKVLVVSDVWSRVKSVRLLLTDGRKRLILPLDGFYDGKEERFSVPSGTLVVEVEDERQNSAVYTLKVP